MIEILPIYTDRLVIRQFRSDDASAFHSWRSDADVARYTLWDFPYPMDEAKSFCKEQASLAALPIGNWCQVFIEERETGAPVGDIGLGLDTGSDGTLEIGYSIHRNHWGKGYATEAVGAVIPVIVYAIGASVIKAEIDARNPASGKVLSKLGFEAGPLHKKRTFVKGEWCDEIVFLLQASHLQQKAKI